MPIGFGGLGAVGASIAAALGDSRNNTLVGGLPLGFAPVQEDVFRQFGGQQLGGGGLALGVPVGFGGQQLATQLQAPGTTPPDIRTFVEGLNVPRLRTAEQGRLEGGIKDFGDFVTTPGDVESAPGVGITDRLGRDTRALFGVSTTPPAPPGLRPLPNPTTAAVPDAIPVDLAGILAGSGIPFNPPPSIPGAFPGLPAPSAPVAGVVPEVPTLPPPGQRTPGFGIGQIPNAPVGGRTGESPPQTLGSPTTAVPALPAPFLDFNPEIQDRLAREFAAATAPSLSSALEAPTISPEAEIEAAEDQSLGPFVVSLSKLTDQELTQLDTAKFTPEQLEQTVEEVESRTFEQGQNAQERSEALEAQKASEKEQGIPPRPSSKPGAQSLLGPLAPMQIAQTRPENAARRRGSAKRQENLRQFQEKTPSQVIKEIFNFTPPNIPVAPPGPPPLAPGFGPNPQEIAALAAMLGLA